MQCDPSVIYAAEIVGYESLMTGNTEVASKVARTSWFAFEDLCGRHYGNRINTVMPAKFLAELLSALDAVCCAVGLQRDYTRQSQTDPTMRQTIWHMGIKYEADQSHNNGQINDRLLAIVGPAGICISRHIYEDVLAQVEQPQDNAGVTADVALLRQEIGRIWASVVQIEIALILRSSNDAAIAHSPSIGVAGVVHKRIESLMRLIARLMGGKGRR
ncbi:MAG: hypothetical protein GY727_06025 [Gammaproteobacteria bacterium]|nr:hypothetical protein [Gammaproteobacteria bacterium]